VAEEGGEVGVGEFCGDAIFSGHGSRRVWICGCGHVPIPRVFGAHVESEGFSVRQDHIETQGDGVGHAGECMAKDAWAQAANVIHFAESKPATARILSDQASSLTGYGNRRAFHFTQEAASFELQILPVSGRLNL
jgi:hypothetical protein